MVRACVLTLALVLSALTLTDRFVCPDGCADNTAVAFDCVLCHGFAFDALPMTTVPSVVITRDSPVGAVLPPPPTPRSIEHPPRV